MCLTFTTALSQNGGNSEDGCSDVMGANLCGPETEKIAAVNVACQGEYFPPRSIATRYRLNTISGDEMGLRHCPHETNNDIYCVHEEDVVVGCEGNGDPSGVGLFRKEDTPALARSNVPAKIDLSCGDRPITKTDLHGAAGSTFVARCPQGCSYVEHKRILMISWHHG